MPRLRLARRRRSLMSALVAVPIASTDAPTARCSHSATAVRGELWVIGGGLARPDKSRFTHFDDVHVLRDSTWVKVRTRGASFTARRGHSASLWRDRYIVVFGGAGDGGRMWNDGVWLLDTGCSSSGDDGRGRRRERCATWTRVNPSELAELPGEPRIGHNGRVNFRDGPLGPVVVPPAVLAHLSRPEPRRGHGSFIVGDELFVYGGYTETNIYLKGWLYALDLKRDGAAWRLQQTTGLDPGATALFSSVTTARFWICCGGIEINPVPDAADLSEVWVLDLRSFAWSRAMATAEGSPPPSARFCCSVALLAEHWVVVGKEKSEFVRSPPRSSGLLELLQPPVDSDAAAAAATATTPSARSPLSSFRSEGSAARSVAASPLSFRRAEASDESGGVSELRLRLSIVMFGGSACTPCTYLPSSFEEFDEQQNSNSFYEMHLSFVLRPAVADGSVATAVATAAAVAFAAASAGAAVGATSGGGGSGGGLLGLQLQLSAAESTTAARAGPPLLKRRELHHGMELVCAPHLEWSRAWPVHHDSASERDRVDQLGRAWVHEVGATSTLSKGTIFLRRDERGVVADEASSEGARRHVEEEHLVDEVCSATDPFVCSALTSVEGIAPLARTEGDVQGMEYHTLGATGGARRTHGEIVALHSAARACINAQRAALFGREWSRVRPRAVMLARPSGAALPSPRNAATLTQLAPAAQLITIVDLASTQRGGAFDGDGAKRAFWSRAALIGRVVLFGGGVHGGAYFNDAWMLEPLRRNERMALIATRLLLERQRAVEWPNVERRETVLAAALRLSRGPFRTVVSFI